MALNKRSQRKSGIDDDMFNILMVIMIALIIVVTITAVYLVIIGTTPPADESDNNVSTSVGDYPFKTEISVTVPQSDDDTKLIDKDDVSSEFMTLIDVTDGKVIASRKSSEVMYPASMTKVMTLIVIVENLKSEAELEQVLTISHEYNGNSGYGFKVGEKLTVEDLLYAAILQSDGVACLALAEHIAGSETEFVKLMNAKATEMGLKNTLFQNCTGLHHVYHYTTCNDMAAIMAYAMKNPLCAKVLTAIKYNPSDNFRKGEGCTFWHTLLHNRLADKAIQPNSAEIVGGKTGLTEKDSSGYCVVAYAKGKDGHYYVSVTAKAEGWDANISDVIYVFNTYVE